MVRDGLLYPRWINRANNGFGAPVFLYYSPMTAYAVTVVSFFVTDLVSAFKVVIVAGFFLSGLTFFLAARSFGPFWAAVIGACVYMTAPYHILDIYVRSAVAEYLAFVWLPLLFLLSRRLLYGPSPGAWFGLVFAYAGLVFTHLVTAFMALFVLAPYVLFHVLRTRRWVRVVPLVSAGAVALCLVGVFLIPMLNQLDEVHSEYYVESDYGDWRRNLLFTDEVALGYTKDKIKTSQVEPSITAQAGLGLVAGIWFSALTLYRARRRRRAGRPTDGPVGVTPEGWIWLLLFAWTFFLQTPPSKYFWSLAPGLGSIQFPWRFGSYLTLSVSFLVVCVLAVAAQWRFTGRKDSPPSRKKSPGEGRPAWVSFGLSLVIIVTVGLAAVPGWIRSERLTRFRSYFFDEKLPQRPRYVNLDVKEFLPKSLAGYTKFPRLPAGAIPEVKVLGPGRADVVSWGGQSREVRVEASGAALLLVRTFMHPGWKAWIDGKPVTIRPDPRFRAMTISVPPGTHTVICRFTATSDRKIGAWLSGLTLVGLCVGWFVRKRWQLPWRLSENA